REEIAWIKNSSTPLNTSPRNLSRRYEKIMIFAREGVDYNTNKKKGVITNGQQFYKKMDNVIFAKNKDTHNDAPYHSATYSKELVRQIMRIYYTRGSYIIDPFAGLGTTIHSALQNGMHGLGIDIDLDYVNYANSIIEDIKKQTSLDQYI
ncbi:MAG: hypothetical protein GWN00_28510, partial [Aliifodinibius sp.]|nr:site-specific DNA-methyltransferase [Fodinibius sp.]NIY28601.1 hypothetical protein [Fodinibius sp.]